MIQVGIAASLPGLDLGKERPFTSLHGTEMRGELPQKKKKKKRRRKSLRRQGVPKLLKASLIPVLQRGTVPDGSPYKAGFDRRKTTEKQRKEYGGYGTQDEGTSPAAAQRQEKKKGTLEEDAQRVRAMRFNAEIKQRMWF